ncbi:hypothetical protein Glove_460g63 [Diversispora epigaea]|uniref:Uncharacterized protein n=1 Tax=Diversispora epigaea TaxID=1348612 RepID=A0A397GU58_9GLOM|nr:hypothetical protein Glove_460g63 [Diversispora epigaea]
MSSSWELLKLLVIFNLQVLKFSIKIEPYKKILDKQLWKDINQHLLIPDRPIKLIILPARVLITDKTFSNIISEEQHTGNFILDRSRNNYLFDPYDFQLILHGRDGFAPKTFLLWLY